MRKRYKRGIFKPYNNPKALGHSMVALTIIAASIFMVIFSVSQLRHTVLLHKDGVVTEARVTASEIDLNKLPKRNFIRYRFLAKETGKYYTASDLIGRKDLWVEVPGFIFEPAIKSGKIKVRYSRTNPWRNLPYIYGQGDYFKDLIVVLLLLVIFCWVGLYGFRSLKRGY